MALLAPFKYALTQGWGSTKRADEPAMYAFLGRAAGAFRPAPFKRYAHFHPGLDLAAAEGTPIRAGEAGTVSAAGPNGVSGLRVRVLIRPGTEYGHGHCSKLLVKAGDKVARGQVIALVGHTGGATGPHSHHFVKIGTYIYDPNLFYPGGANANDPRIKPL